MTTTRLALRYSRAIEVVLRLIGMGPARSGVWVDDESVRVEMGWGFRARFPRLAVRLIESGTISAWQGWGVHGWRGGWIVTGSSAGLVSLELSPESRARVMGIPVRLARLRLSLTEPDALTALLGAPKR